MKDVSGPLVYLPAHGMLAGTSAANELVLIDSMSGKVSGRLPGHRGRITCLRSLAGGRVLLSGSADCTALAWDVASALGR